MSEYIEKDALLKAIEPLEPEKERFTLKQEETYWEKLATYGDIRSTIEWQEPADVAPVVHGRWEYIDYYYGEYNFRCSLCGYEQDEKRKFCPECGAKMDESEGQNE